MRKSLSRWTESQPKIEYERKWVLIDGIEVSAKVQNIAETPGAV